MEKSHRSSDVDETRARIKAAIEADPKAGTMDLARQFGVGRDSIRRMRQIILGGNSVYDRRLAVIPDGKILSELCAEGIEMEKDGLSPEEAAANLQISRKVYRHGRDILLLANNPNLGAADKAKARAAVAAMDGTKRVFAAYDDVVPLIQKMWGAARGAPHDSRRLARLIENYMHAVVVFAEGAEQMQNLEVPYLSEMDRTRARDDLKRAKIAVEGAIKRLNGGVR